MPSILYQNKNIHYQISGTGQPVVLLHGYCEDQKMWDHFIPLLPSEKYITIDLPGFGNSEVIPDISIEGMAEIIMAVLEKLKIEKTILIGHSMGGYISLAFAEKYPAALTGLGLFHSHPYADSALQTASRNKSINFLKRNGVAHYAKQLIPKLFPAGFTKFNVFLVNNLIYRASRFPVEGLICGQQAMRDRPDRSKVLTEINCPVHFIIGKKDTLIDEESALEQTTLPDNSLIHILPDAGHMGMFEYPKKTAAMVWQFIKYCQKDTVRNSSKITLQF